MDKKLTFWSATVFVVLYFVAVFAAEFIGFIHPVCWVLAPALGALLAALPYRWLSLRWRMFGLGTVLAAVFGLLMLAMGEVDFTRLLIIVGCGLVSDLVRLATNKDCLTYPILALGNIAMIVYLWTRKAWYLQGAVEEMPAGYDQLMLPVIENIPVLVVVLVLTIPMAMFAIWLATRAMKKRTEALE